MSYYNELYYKSYTGYLQTTLNADVLARNSKEQAAAIENAGKAIVASNMASAALLNRGMNELGYSMNAGFSQLSGDINAGFNQLSGNINDGFDNVSREIGNMGAAMRTGFMMMDKAVKESSRAICGRLDLISDTLRNPSLTQAREYYRRAQTNYEKGFFEEALEDVKKSLDIHRVDYEAWFLMGKVYLFGAGEFSQVVDLDQAISALGQAAKYITPDSRAIPEARLLAAEVFFFWALAKQNKAYDIINGGTKEGAEQLLSESLRSYSQSYAFSETMLEAMFMAARCHVSMGNPGEALVCLEVISKKDPRYVLKTALEPEFKNLQREYTQLIGKLRLELVPVVQKELAECRQLAGEAKNLDLSVDKFLASLDAIENALKDMPYVDMFELHLKQLPELKSKIANEIESEEGRRAEERKEIASHFYVKDGELIRYDGSRNSNLTIPEFLGIKKIGKWAFATEAPWDHRYNSNGLRRLYYWNNVIIPNGVTSIGDYAFAGCDQLTSVVIPNSVTSIGEGAFAQNKLLSIVNIPDSLASIGKGAFAWGDSLREITIPGSLASIAEDTFRGCKSLTKVIIQEGVSSIGKGAFYNCERLMEITIPASLTSIAEGALPKKYLETIYGPSIKDDLQLKLNIPEGTIYLSYGANESWSGQLISVTIPEGLMSIEKYKGVLGDDLVSLYNSKSLFKKSKAGGRYIIIVDDYKAGRYHWSYKKS
jgi:tetratricopeptide (TPR) repeat protein